ncbi:MAG: hypothetical protein KC983_03030 [Phycisphaerales bacterium]|nr:hypothetical protein [Phycisphaerales bacterium]
MTHQDDPSPPAGRSRLLRALAAHARKIIVTVMGTTILLTGLLVVLTPVPIGWLLIPLGLVLLAGEFACARRWLDAIQNNTGRIGASLRRAEHTARARAPKLFPPAKNDAP